ncbi:MAG: Zn-dependent exopeptidase M28 [Actinobacteria bacterium]|nr:Zn-dependent exopeptidase M28 [Actinomycetota bacterium]MBU1943849.1 Zn-dependent exopeptidase M28 [Actinomycetota bacterium]MBU2687670.1 Zn-dependent exopeptidase M28 [Actinomycetota bacterium]
MGMSEDVYELAVEIGPRGACTPAEGIAARYIRGRFEERGLECETQEFFTIDTYSYLYMIYLSVAIACAVASFWFPYVAAPLALVNAVLFALDLETFPVVSRLLPQRLSRNVIGRAPSEEGGVSLVVVAHYDSARSALSFSPGMVKGFRKTFSLMIGCVFGVALLCWANLVIWIARGDANLWVWIPTVVISAYLLVPLYIMIHREAAMTHTSGANDNASGVAAMLALMDKVSEERLGGVMFVATGAEEVGTAGMIRFLAEHGEEVRDALIVNLDNLGIGHLCYIDCEGMLFGHRSDPVLLWLSGKVVEARRFPVWKSSYRLLSTDATPALARGYRAMSLMAFDDDGRLPNWHWETDTVEHLSIENLETARGFLWNLVKATTD